MCGWCGGTGTAQLGARLAGHKPWQVQTHPPPAIPGGQAAAAAGAGAGPGEHGAAGVEAAGAAASRVRPPVGRAGG